MSFTISHLLSTPSTEGLSHTIASHQMVPHTYYNVIISFPQASLPVSSTHNVTTCYCTSAYNHRCPMTVWGVHSCDNIHNWSTIMSSQTTCQHSCSVLQPQPLGGFPLHSLTQLTITLQEC